MWITSYIVTAAVVVIVSTVLALAVDRAQRRVDFIVAQVQLDEDQQRQARAMLDQIDHYKAVLARHERLSWPIPVGEIIAHVGAVTPDRVTLTSLSVSPRLRGQRRSSGSANADTAYEVMDVEIAGVAVDDLDIAAFVAGLQDLDIFSAVIMDYARKAKLGEGEAREFGLSCTVDLTARYIREREDEP